MTKPFKSIDDQLNLLLSRGLIFNDQEEAKRYLLTNNYYNVINCYGKFFLNHSNTYYPNSNFNEIVSIHQFDKEIKNTLFKHIIEIEQHFKSAVSHIFSEHRSSDSYPYLNPANYENSNILGVSSYISSLSSIIQNQGGYSHDNSIKHYLNNHNNVPLWVLCNYMTFGSIVKFYKLMKRNEQNQIAKVMSTFLCNNLEITNIKLTPEQLISFLDNICELRNGVAHNNKLFRFMCRRNTAHIAPLHSIYGIAANVPRQDIYNIIIVMQAFLSKFQYAQLHNTILSRAKTLNKKLSTIGVDDVLSTLGFPVNWINTTSKRAQD